MIINHVELRTPRRQEWMEIAFVHENMKDVANGNELRMNTNKTRKTQRGELFIEGMNEN